MSVVVKQLVDGAEADDRYAREVAALRLSARVYPPVAPRLLGADPRERMLVLEYVDQQEPPADWAVAYATALARLHAATTADDTSSSVLPAWSGPTDDDVQSFLGLAQQLDVAVTSRVRAELDDVLDRLSRTPGHALLHGDPCPDNALHTSSGVRFIDFEQAALGNGLAEVAYLRIGFPTCWCSTSPTQALLDAAETAYRTAWHQATGTDVLGDLTDACAGWLLRGDALVQRAHRGTVDHLARLPKQDWEWGTATARERLVHRLGILGEMSADREELTTLGRLAASMRANMLARWPALRPLPQELPELT